MIYNSLYTASPLFSFILFIILHKLLIGRVYCILSSASALFNFCSKNTLYFNFFLNKITKIKRFMMDKYISLKNGVKMPKFGLGCGAIKSEETVTAIGSALDAGCRLFDCALLYGNEPCVGNALKQMFDIGKVKREDVFITSKLPMIGNHPSRVEYFLKKSLQNLQVEYVDLYLIHFPAGFEYADEEPHVYFPRDENGSIKFDYSTDIISVWKAMEEQVKAGRCKSIGVSNFSCEQMQRIMDVATEPIANIQIEVHAYFQQKELRKFCKAHEITVSAYAPLGSPGRREAFIGSQGIPQVLTDPVVATIAEKYNKNAAQVLIRFLYQDDVIALPKSSLPERIMSNFDIFDFSLSDEEVSVMRGLDKGETGRTFDYLEIFTGIENHPENPLASQAKMENVIREKGQEDVNHNLNVKDSKREMLEA